MNNLTKTGLGLCLTVAIAACGGGPSKDEAQIGYALAKGFAGTASAQAQTQNPGSLTQRQEGSLSFSQPCASGGTIGMSGDFSGTTADFSFTFDQCNQGGTVIDGGWDIGGTADTLTMVGTLSITHPEFEISCEFDLRVSNNGATIAGTACGYDVSELEGG